MPRQARLDAPGVLHHIMIRGIERRKIFINDRDRKDFLERLSKLLPQSETACYAWVFIPNHGHFLFRTGLAPLVSIMRRLLTGYAVSFNRRHRRHGHSSKGGSSTLLRRIFDYFRIGTPVTLFHLFSSKVSDGNVKIKQDVTLKGERI